MTAVINFPPKPQTNTHILNTSILQLIQRFATHSLQEGFELKSTLFNISED